MSEEKNYKPVKTNKVGGSPFKGVLGWLDDRLPIFRMFKYEYLDFQVPRSLNYFLEFWRNTNGVSNIVNYNWINFRYALQTRCRQGF